MNFFARRLGIVALALAACCGGCASKNGNPQVAPPGEAFNLVVLADEEFFKKRTKVELDLVPAYTESEKNVFTDRSVHDYFRNITGNDVRKNQKTKKTIILTTANPREEITRKDPIWKGQWSRSRGKTMASYLIVVADITGDFPEGAAPNDARRFVIALDNKEWRAKNKTLTIQIQTDGVKVLPGSPDGK